MIADKNSLLSHEIIVKTSCEFVSCKIEQDSTSLIICALYGPLIMIWNIW